MMALHIKIYMRDFGLDNEINISGPSGEI